MQVRKTAGPLLLHAYLPHSLSEYQKQIERIDRQQKLTPCQLNSEQNAKPDPHIHGGHGENTESGGSFLIGIKRRIR